MLNIHNLERLKRKWNKHKNSVMWLQTHKHEIIKTVNTWNLIIVCHSLQSCHYRPTIGKINKFCRNKMLHENRYKLVNEPVSDHPWGFHCRKIIRSIQTNVKNYAKEKIQFDLTHISSCFSVMLMQSQALEIFSSHFSICPGACSARCKHFSREGSVWSRAIAGGAIWITPWFGSFF